jgi:hypothetical protein
MSQMQFNPYTICVPSSARTFLLVLTLAVLFPFDVFASDNISRKPDCGVLATEIILGKFGLNIRQSSDFEELCRRAPLSLADLESIFRKHELHVQSYRLDDVPDAWFDKLSDGECYAVVLLPVRPDKQISASSPGHFNLVIRKKNDEVELLDPTTGLRNKLNTRLDFKIAKAGFVQFVHTDRWSGFETPVGMIQWCLLGTAIAILLAYTWANYRVKRTSGNPDQYHRGAAG